MTQENSTSEGLKSFTTLAGKQDSPLLTHVFKSLHPQETVTKHIIDTEAKDKS